MAIEKIKELEFKELIQLKDVVNEILLRNRMTDIPSERWLKFNDLLGAINREIENRIYNEFIA